MGTQQRGQRLSLQEIALRLTARGSSCSAARLGVDTLSFRLEDGLVGLVGVLHGDGVGELIQHSLLEGLQPFVVMPSTHKLLILEAK